jgi:tRNA 2-thiouridine synthesizing protein A
MSKGQQGAAPFLRSSCRSTRCSACRAADSLLELAYSQGLGKQVKTITGERAVVGIGEGNTTVTGQPDAELDLRGVICPYNFVKTKLKLEAMEQGQTLSVLLDDGDPIRNVPRSVSNEGHTILSQDRVQGSYRVLIRRREDE